MLRRGLLRAGQMIALSTLLGGTASAQDSILADRETIRQLAQQIRQLQEKVAALEAKQGSAPSTTADTSSVPASGDASASASQLASFQEAHEVRGIRWRGFGEVNYKVLNQRQPELATFGFVPGSAGNFYTGDFDLFLTSKISEKESVLADGGSHHRGR